MIKNLYERSNFEDKLEYLSANSIKYENLMNILENNYKNLIYTEENSSDNNDINNYLSTIKDFEYNNISYPSGKVLIYSDKRIKGIDCISLILNTFGYKSLNEIIIIHYKSFSKTYSKKKLISQKKRKDNL